MAKKPVKRAETVEVVYGEERWKLLKQLRERAVQILEPLDKRHLRCIVHVENVIERIPLSRTKLL